MMIENELTYNSFSNFLFGYIRRMIVCMCANDGPYEYETF